MVEGRDCRIDKKYTGKTQEKRRKGEGGRKGGKGGEVGCWFPIAIGMVVGFWFGFVKT